MYFSKITNNVNQHDNLPLAIPTITVMYNKIMIGRKTDLQGLNVKCFRRNLTFIMFAMLNYLTNKIAMLIIQMRIYF